MGQELGERSRAVCVTSVCGGRPRVEEGAWEGCVTKCRAVQGISLSPTLTEENTGL